MINLALLVGVFNGFGDFLTRLSAGKISPLLGSATLSLSAAAVPIAYLFVTNSSDQIWATKQGIFISALSGAAIGLSATTFFVLFGRGAVLSQIQPIIKILVILTAVFMGIIFLGERMDFAKIMGILFALVAVVLLAK